MKNARDRTGARKRGKIEELNSLSSRATDQHPYSPRRPLDRTIRYVITLDADTALPPHSAAKNGRDDFASLQPGAASIRLQRSPHERLYSIIQPRVAIALPGATATRFTRAFADTSGLDPYCRSVSDIQQDYFIEGTFHGKAAISLTSNCLRHHSGRPVSG